MRPRLKKIRPEAVTAALAKAEKYRDLNQPAEAESICRDVLAASPDHPGAQRTLGIALTDQFEGRGMGRYAEARELFSRLPDPFERSFYTGLACERQGRAQLKVGRLLRSSLPLFEEALTFYEKAEACRPAGNDDPILRWNSIVRTLEAHPEYRDLDLQERLPEGDDAPPRL